MLPPVPLAEDERDVLLSTMLCVPFSLPFSLLNILLLLPSRTGAFDGFCGPWLLTKHWVYVTLDSLYCALH